MKELCYQSINQILTRAKIFPEKMITPYFLIESESRVLGTNTTWLKSILSPSSGSASTSSPIFFSKEMNKLLQYDSQGVPGAILISAGVSSIKIITLINIGCVRTNGDFPQRKIMIFPVMRKRPRNVAPGKVRRRNRLNRLFD